MVWCEKRPGQNANLAGLCVGGSNARVVFDELAFARIFLVEQVLVTARGDHAPRELAACLARIVRLLRFVLAHVFSISYSHK